MQRYVVSDLNQAMLDTAKSRQPPDDRVTFQQADAMRLPFADASFDSVLCQFGVMFFPDKVAGLREARRVLRPGGRLLFNVWDRIEENGFTEIVVREAAPCSLRTRRSSWRARPTATTIPGASKPM